MSFLNRVDIQSADNATVDAFGKIQTSQLYTMFDAKQTNDNAPLFWDTELINGGTATHSISGASTIMEVTTTGDAVIRQTKQRFNYQSGKGQDILMTGTFSPILNTNAKAGYFHSSYTTPFNTGYDGVWFEGDETTVYCVIYKSGVEKHKVAQANWNIDRLDGSGGQFNPSGITSDWTKSQILHIDFEWLGIGRVRWFLVINGKKVQVHEYNISNSDIGVYMSSPNQPLRYELRSTGGSATLEQICSSVSSQGGLDRNGVLRSIPDSAVIIGNGANECVLAFRLKDGYDDITAFPSRISILDSDGDNIRWYLTLNATLSTPLLEGTTFTSLPNSSIEYITPDVTVTDEGIIVEEGYATTGNEVIASNPDSAIRLGRAIDGTRDIWYLCVQNLGNGGTVRRSVGIRELL